VAPAWHLRSDGEPAYPVTLSLEWRDGCAIDVPYVYYRPPLVRELIPPVQPRHGDFAMELALDDAAADALLQLVRRRFHRWAPPAGGAAW
jgi:hypothetical protein